MPNPLPIPSAERLEEIAKQVERYARENKQLLGFSEDELALLKSKNRLLGVSDGKRIVYGAEGSIVGRIMELRRARGAGPATAPGLIEKAEIRALSALVSNKGLGAGVDRLRFKYAESELDRISGLVEELPVGIIPLRVKTPYSEALGRMWAKLREQRKLRGTFTYDEWQTVKAALKSYTGRHPESNFARLSMEQKSAREAQDLLWEKIQSSPAGKDKNLLQVQWLTTELTEMQPRWDRQMASMMGITDPATREENLSIDLARKWHQFELREGVGAVPTKPAEVPPVPAPGKFRFAPKSGVVRPASAPVGPEYAPPQGVSAAQSAAEAAGRVAPERRIIVQRGMHGQVTVVFPDADHKLLFDALSKRAMEQHETAERLRFAAARFGVSPETARKMAEDYRGSVMANVRDLEEQSVYIAPFARRPEKVVDLAAEHRKMLAVARDNFAILSADEQEHLRFMLTGKGLKSRMDKRMLENLEILKDWLETNEITFDELTGIQTLAPRRVRAVELDY